MTAISPICQRRNTHSVNPTFVYTTHNTFEPGTQLTRTTVTCMDCRIDPSSAFGIDLGDAHVIRNAGGSAREELRSLVISEQLLGTNEIFVIKHTHCGMMGLTNESISAVIAKNLGAAALDELKGLDWRGFPDLETGGQRRCCVFEDE